MAGFLISTLVVLMAVGNLSGVIIASGDVHVVGGDQGWDATSDVASWATGRIFRAGDNIWFMYSAAQESVAELGSKEEYESCDITNPIRMYTGGLDRIKLNRRGPRYFVSSAPESCIKGLKLHVHVEPQQERPAGNQELNQVPAAAAVVGAAGPKPSNSVKVGPALSVLFCAGLALLCMVGFFQSVQ